MGRCQEFLSQKLDVPVFPRLPETNGRIGEAEGKLNNPLQNVRDGESEVGRLKRSLEQEQADQKARHAESVRFLEERTAQLAQYRNLGAEVQQGLSMFGAASGEAERTIKHKQHE